MKTAKKLFSLLLVAVLLFSAVPFQASAATGAFTVIFKNIDGTEFARASADPINDYVTVPAGKPNMDVFNGWSVPGTVYAPTATSISAHKDCFTNYVLEVVATGHNHTLVDNGTMSSAPTCTADGAAVKTCSFCGTHITTVVPALGHNFQETVDATTITAASCTATGLKTVKCSRCNETQNTTIPATGHSLTTITDTERNQTVTSCSNCDYVAYGKVADTVSFVNNHVTGNNSQRQYMDGELVTDVPTAAKIYGKHFLGWFANDGTQMVANQTVWHDTSAKTYYANYESSTNDGLSRVTVKCVYYVGTEAVATKDLYVVDLEDGTNIQTWLSNNYAKTNLAIQNNRPDSAQYNWELIGKYYNLVNNTPVTASDLVANGDVTIAVKAYADKSDIRNVYLYIHNKAGEKEVDIIHMTGFPVGSQVTVTNAQNAYKNKYNRVPTFANGVLYNENAWSEGSAGSLSYTVGSDGLIVHAIVTGHTATSTSKPASNPATGDMITTTAVVMVLSAAAFVALTQLRKRKMI